MHGGIIEFHALPDTDGAGAKDNDLLLVRETAVIHSAVGGIQVGDVLTRVERIDHTEHWRDAEFFTPGIELGFLKMPDFRNPSVRESHFLGFPENVDIIDM